MRRQHLAFTPLQNEGEKGGLESSKNNEKIRKRAAITQLISRSNEKNRKLSGIEN